jgi:hypothetical protein
MWPKTPSCLTGAQATRRLFLVAGPVAWIGGASRGRQARQAVQVVIRRGPSRPPFPPDSPSRSGWGRFFTSSPLGWGWWRRSAWMSAHGEVSGTGGFPLRAMLVDRRSLYSGQLSPARDLHIDRRRCRIACHTPRPGVNHHLPRLALSEQQHARGRRRPVRLLMVITAAARR